MDYPYPMLNPPAFRWAKPADGSRNMVHEWIRTLPEPGALADSPVDWREVDVTLLGVPLSRTSISASAASEAPDALRQAWRYFATYQLEYGVDLSPLRVVDLGDVRQHVTDIPLNHRRIQEAMTAMRRVHPQALPVVMGGDHSITAMLVMGMKAAHPEKKIGLLQFDTHLDLRPLEDNGPTNGTPIRRLIESGTVSGRHVWNIGPHGFYNAKPLMEYADEAGVHVVPLAQARRQGMARVVDEALTALDNEVDLIYVTVDMDVLDIAFAPGVPAATPGGMRPDELFEAVFQAGRCPKTAAMDLVCIDPRRDIAVMTVKAGVQVLLTFLTGFRSRV